MNLDNLFFEKIIENIYDGVFCYDTGLKLVYANNAAERITGFKPSELQGKECVSAGICHYDDSGLKLCATELCPVKRAMAGNVVSETELNITHAEGYKIAVVTRVLPVKNAQGKVCGAVEIFANNISNIKAFRQIEKLKKLAFIDSLTETGNRAYSEIKIHSKLLDTKKSSFKLKFGILFIDIDRFKAINDTYGHEIGDRALKLIARTMMSSVRAQDFVGRWGGEEFVIVLHEVGETELRYIAEKIRYNIEKSVLPAAGAEIRMTVSIGATLVWETDTLETIIARADKLMYSCKARGRNSVSVSA